MASADTTISPGSHLLTQHMSDVVKVYPISEDKLDALGDLNLIATMALSLAMTAWGIFAALYWDLKYAGADSAGWAYANIWMVVAIVLSVITAICFFRRYRGLTRLKQRAVNFKYGISIQSEHDSQ